MSLDAATGEISSALIGGQGTYTPEIVVTDSTKATPPRKSSSPSTGTTAFWRTFSRHIRSSIIGWTRRPPAPVDTSPAAPMYSAYLPESIKPFFGNKSAEPYPTASLPSRCPPNRPRPGKDDGLSVLLHVAVHIRPMPPSKAPAGPLAVTDMFSSPRGGHHQQARLYEMWTAVNTATAPGRMAPTHCGRT